MAQRLLISSIYNLSVLDSSASSSSEQVSIVRSTTSERREGVLSISTVSWSNDVLINGGAQTPWGSTTIQGLPLIWTGSTPSGSWLVGTSGNDVIRGLDGWDILDGGGGDDLIRAGNGRDILTGGLGSDELHGDFGWNTYSSERDGFVDLIAIKSDQWLVNGRAGKAGNNPNGEKADVLEGLDPSDQIRIIGVATDEIIVAQAAAHGMNGVGLFAKGALEVLYVGGDLSIAELQAMTTGDNSPTAMANQVWSYWHGNEVPPLIGA
jgi:Ca2+-binding RTX toxin-like protein